KLVREAGLINSQRQEVQAVPPSVPVLRRRSPQTATSKANGSAAVESFLRQLLAEHLQCSPEAIDLKAGYYEQGLTSAALLGLVQAIGNKVGAVLPPILLFEYTTVAALAAYLA